MVLCLGYRSACSSIPSMVIEFTAWVGVATTEDFFVISVYSSTLTPTPVPVQKKGTPMRTAIIGCSGSGKSDLYAALAGPNKAAVSPRVTVKVLEPRLMPLIVLYHPKKVTYSEIEYLDVFGGINVSSLGERMLNEARPADCLLAVLDNFSGLVDPNAQKVAIDVDTIVSDLAVVEKRLERISLDRRKSRNVLDLQEKMLQQAQILLESERPLRSEQALADNLLLRGFSFLSAKPILYAWNCKESSLADFILPQDDPNIGNIKISARLERELSEFSDPIERKIFLADLGLTVSVLDLVVAKTYELLGLIAFFTAGHKEVRAWAVRRGVTAPEAAGIIHSDIQKGFIRAEVLGWNDFLNAGDHKKAKALGLARLEGKDYIVADGDIIEFRFNV
ncbi:Redox-regulated ATPase YchF [Desulfovibrionales bacterium]